MTNRNPDIKIDEQEIPNGMQLVEGKNLRRIARAKKIPFGVATTASGNYYQEPVGLIIRDGDVAAMKDAIDQHRAKVAAKAAAVKKPKKPRAEYVSRCRPDIRRWTEEEMQTIRKHAKTHGADYIAGMLGRSAQAVYRKACQYKISMLSENGQKKRRGKP